MTTRAEKRRALRDSRKTQKFDGPNQQFVTLQNPVAEHFESFVAGNALVWEQMAHDELVKQNPVEAERLEPFFGLAGLYASNFTDGEMFAKWQKFRALVDEWCGNRFMLTEGSGSGQHLVICGAGPSLKDHAAEYCETADQVWGCNSAAIWLRENGHRCTHAYTVDQTADMVNEWETAPEGMIYLLASTVHPHLVEHLRSKGRGIQWFHNYVGIKGEPVTWPDADGKDRTMGREDWLYATLFPFCVRAGSGLNAVTRALDCAVFAGFKKITILGADCALRTTGPIPENVDVGSPEYLDWLRTNTVMHADGGSALASNASAMTFNGEIDGRVWVTKADLIISAVWLTKMARRLGGLVEIVGDTLPNALANKDDDYLARLPTMIDSEGNVISVP